MEGVNVSYFGYVRTYDLHDHCRHLKCFHVNLEFQTFFSSKFKYWGMLGYTVRQLPKKIVNRCLSFPKKVIHRWRYILLHTMYKHFYINIRQSIYTPNFIESHTQAQFSNNAFDFHNIYSSLFNNIDEKRGPFQTVLSQKSEHTQPLS